MSPFRLLLRLIRWDIVRELRRKDSVFNMVLFAVLVLFLLQMGLAPLFARLKLAPDDFLRLLVHRVGGVVYWVTVLFAGSVGLTQSFAAEREGDALTGVVLSPFDLGIFYLAKVVATWLYIILMELALLAGYLVLFGFENVSVLPRMIACLAVFSLGFVALGTVLSAMTTALRGGGEVILRLLLFPLLLPMIYLTLGVPEATFGLDVTGGQLGDPMSFWTYITIILAIDVIYLTAGFVAFPKIFEE